MAEDRQLDLRELGVSGLRRFSGYIFEEPLKELQGQEWRRIIAEMELDPVVGSILFAVDMLIRRVQWTVKPASEDNEDQRIAKFVDGCLLDMRETWTETVSEILTMLPYGWSLHELVYKERLGPNPPPQFDPQWQEWTPGPTSRHNDGLIGWHSWAIRSQDSLLRWEFRRNGDLIGMWQLAPPEYALTLIPMDKSLLFRTKMRKGNPEGRSILRSAYRPWYMKKNIENIEGIGIERDLAGLPVAYVPPELLSSAATADQQGLLSTIKEIITNIRRDEQEGIVWPLAYDENSNLLFDLKLLSTGGTRQFDTDRIVARYDQRIAMTTLADFILLGHENVGSFSLSQDKSDLFITAIEAWLDTIADTINRHAIPPLLALNGWGDRPCPTIEHGEITKISLKDLGDYISQLSGARILLPDDELEEHLRRQADLPEIPKEAAGLRAQMAQLAVANGRQPASNQAYSEREQAAMLQAAARILTRGV